MMDASALLRNLTAGSERKTSKVANDRFGQITLGWAYTSVGARSCTWTVKEIYAWPNLPPHVRLVSSQAQRAMTISASILLDRRRFTRLDSLDESQVG